MALKIFLLAQFLLFPAIQLMAGSLMIDTTPGATITVNGNFFMSLEKNESTITLGSDLFDGTENTVRLQIHSDGYKPLATILSINMIEGDQPLILTLTPLPFWIRWGNQILSSSLILFFGIAGFLLYKKRRKSETSPFHDANSVSDPESITKPILKEFGNYSLMEHIASGGISKIYRAKNIKGETVALKVMTNFLNDRDMVGKFIGEGQALKNINVRFPSAPVVDVYDFGRENQESDGTPFIAMELVDGVPLSEKIKIDLFTNAEKIEILKQLTEALHATHSVDVIHRDISPDNVLIRKKDNIEICLIDFGVAKHEVNWLKGTSYGAAYGKPEYMSPEQFSGDSNLDYRSDYYSLGILAFTLFCGEAPFRDPNTYKVGDMHKNDPIPKMPDHVPEHIQGLIKKMMAKDPAGRPKSPTEILSFLNIN